MKQSISRRQFLKASGLAAAGACAAGLLSCCGGKSGGSSSGSASGADTSKYTVLYSSQPATLNYQTTATDLEMVVGANCVDTLVEYDNKGVMKEGLATSWDWDVDTLTWTFHLRDENWVDCNGEVVAPVTAQDFVDALKYVLTPDYASSNVDLVTSYIAGADDYYNYYVYLANANGDGRITITDVVKQQNYADSLRGLDEAAMMAGDINGDGRITITDVVQAAQVTVGQRTI